MKLLEENKNIIIQSYLNGTSVASLTKTYHVSQWSINNLLRKNNIKTRTLNDLKTKFSEDFLLSQTSESYYFWGFMLGDGCLITHKQGHKYLTVSLKSDDECILHNFCKWLQIDTKHIKHGKNNCNTNYSRLELYGKFFSMHDFSDLGFVSNKTYNPSNLKIPHQFIKHFILGLIDADGTVMWNTKKGNVGYYINIVGHKQNMDWVTNSLRQIGFDGNVNQQLIKSDFKRIRIQRKNDIVDLVKILDLKNNYHFCLSRKWSSLYEKIISQ